MSLLPLAEADALGWDSASLYPLRCAMITHGGLAGLSNRALREVLNPVCTAGQLAGREAEEMVILLKTLWPNLGPPEGPTTAHDETFERVVSIGIAEYYRDAPQTPE